MISKLTDNKLVVALVVPLILWMVAWASGMSELPSTVKQHEGRITNVEVETRALRESAIKRDTQFEYIAKALERMEKREERRR